MTNNNSVRICAVVCEQSAGELTQAMARAAEVADIIELRLDCLIDVSSENLFAACVSLLQDAKRPVIITLRSADEGGRQTIERGRRLEFWRSEICRLLSFKEVFVDIETDIVSELAGEKELSGSIDWRRVICSHHDFAGMPAELSKIYDSLSTTPARILKIAVRANDATDCIPIFRLLEHPRDEGREVIAIAMDQAGIATRILGPSQGAFLTYGSLDSDHATAPGQVSALELAELYRVREINSQTQVFGLMGNPISHSLSPHIHNAAFSSKGINAV
ncbi:MAG: type I 3-dehydroquinate dehydratase, partial [Pyrinomonadaceae bacterium]